MQRGHQGYLHHFAYFSSFKEHKRLPLHWLRDVAAFAEIQAVMMESGYGAGRRLLNFKYDASAPEPARVDTHFLRPEDLLVVVTRPPLNEIHGQRKPEYASRSSLETEICQTLRHYFSVCSRRRVRLTETIAKQLPSQYADRADVRFNMHVGAFCSGYAGLYDAEYKDVELPQRAPDEPRVDGITLAYFVRLPRLYVGGPGLMVVFGMGGNETLIWAHLLRSRFREVLTGSEFFMAEIEEEPFPTTPFTTLGFIDEWKVNPILNIPAKPLARARRGGAASAGRSAGPRAARGVARAYWQPGPISM